MKFVKPIISVLALLVLVKIFFLFPFFHSLEYKASDAMFRFRGVQPVSDSLIIVSIDDETFNALNETWPFPRNYHAKLIDNLTRAGVKQIVFDVEFTENSDPENDRILGESALASNRVIFAGKVINSTKLGEPSQMLQPISSIMKHELPWGIVNMNADSDGFIRKYTLFELFDNNPIYSLGIISLAQLQDGQSDKASINLNHPHQLNINSQQIPIIEHNSALINFYGPEGTFRKISYSSILDDSTTAMPGYFGEELNEYYDILNSGVLKDKIALIGATVDELHDKFPTPYGGDWTSGVEIHANFLEMVKNDNYLTMLNPFLNFLIEFLLALCLWHLFKAKKPQISAFAAIFAIFAVFTASYLSFVYGNIVIHIVQVIILIILIFVASILIHYLQTLKEKRFIRSAFQQYMAPELVAKLLSDPQNLKYGGSLQEVSVLFSDIRSFTTYSESHTPAETVEILREYLTEMVKIIINNQGILDKFVGDEVMALFGTPVPLPNHALSACKVALQMRKRLTELQNKWLSEGRQALEIGIGINTGMAVVGNLGSEQIFDYTAIGDTINLGARLEGINKEYPTAKHIIISEFTLEKVKDMVIVNYLDEVTVKGKNTAVKIYELVDII